MHDGDNEPADARIPSGDRKPFARLLASPKTFVVLACLIILAIWSVTIQTVLSERQTRLEMGKARALELSGLFETHTINVLGYADTYTKAARQAYMRRGSVADLQAFLHAAPPNMSIISHVTVFNAAGRPVFVSTGHVVDPAASVADRPYFQFHKENPGDQTYVSVPILGRNTGLLTIRLARRIDSVDGRFAGVIFAAILLDKLTGNFEALDLGENGAVGLIGLDGMVRAWSVNGRQLPDHDMTGSALWPALMAGPVGLFNETSPLDGVNRDMAYRKLTDYPLVASIGIAGIDTLRAESHHTWSVLAIAGLMTLVVLVLAASSLRDARLLGKLKREVAVRRRAEAEAVRATEIKSAFLATMSHEVRTPINSILGLFELIERADIPERQKRQARAGQTAAAQLFQQLSNVLDASRLEAKSLDLTLRDEPVAPLVGGYAQPLEASVSGSGKAIQCSARILGDVPQTVRMDRRRVDQIVLNLIDNAVKFTDAGRIDLTVSAETTAGQPMLKIAVSDTGAGIPADSHERAFTRFAQLDSAIAQRARGTGLGLSICRDLAELMQGRLVVHSEPGAGSTFSLILPMKSSV